MLYPKLCALAATLLLTISCLPKLYFQPRYDREAHERAAAAGRCAILHPLVRAHAPEAPEADSDKTVDLIGEYLEANGYEVRRRHLDLEQEVWVARMVNEGHITGELRRYIEEVGGDCGLVMFPSVVARQAQLRGQKAWWDGVVRPIPHDGNVHSYNWSGYQEAVSLSIAVFDSNAEVVQSSLGGLEIPFRMTFAEPFEADTASAADKTATATRGEPRNYLSASPVITEAIQLALHPMIPMAGYPDKPDYLQAEPPQPAAEIASPAELECTDNAAACLRLGKLQLTGEGDMKKDLNAALGSLTRACGLGNAEACNVTGELYRLMAERKASVYFAKACDLGHEEGCTRLEKRPRGTPKVAPLESKGPVQPPSPKKRQRK